MTSEHEEACLNVRCRSLYIQYIYIYIYIYVYIYISVYVAYKAYIIALRPTN